ncbi:translesion error-prone DNA polymerase V autoproteolytic subunit [Pseudomonas syringae]|uniref:LexA family protein n=1 Tax=Pseudomonas ovata TaxID=1839709 RepID=UPI000D68D4DF|nr:S24 family peptidase [Pseudomonas ovata]MBD8577527.1 translesion error-prone DNA polymerase V autoproteolytic subunit [Pseudomonas syringae]MBD8792738.1 translesion error-prone DNA polymerase V autoproteolytic subunit [Pseudomonas syringae]MBD8803229.1 translesion error-prone DNA polymerase V autoproteolytic subunit [Pseudomonas syringae]MBD8814049.1 translesion error-prone DNA polymerase V autoproteolytic subunit [Pseudomonas syringae]
MSVIVLGKLEHNKQSIKVPLYSFKVPAGFPSPAADHIEKHLSLDELFNVRAPHIYLAKIQGDSMQGAGIYDGDLVIVDRSQEALHGEIVIAALNGEPLCKRLHRQGREIILQSENKAYSPRFVLEQDELMIWGVVRYSVRDHDHA